MKLFISTLLALLFSFVSINASAQVSTIDTDNSYIAFDKDEDGKKKDKKKGKKGEEEPECE